MIPQTQGTMFERLTFDPDKVRVESARCRYECNCKVWVVYAGEQIINELEVNADSYATSAEAESAAHSFAEGWQKCCSLMSTFDLAPTES